jgi:hypothetical protein
MRKLLALLTCASLLVSGCATAGATRVPASPSPVNRDLLAEFVHGLPLGSNVRVDLTNGHVIKGTLMKATDTVLVVQRRTRIPEPPDEIAFDQVTAVQLQANGGPGKAIAIGAAAGAAAALGVLLILAAIFSGD